MNEEYNVQMTSDQKKALIDKFPSISVVDRWSANDWNVCMPADIVDDFMDWCEENNIECKLV